jgi:hypothetical protein
VHTLTLTSVTHLLLLPAAIPNFAFVSMMAMRSPLSICSFLMAKLELFHSPPSSTLS